MYCTRVELVNEMVLELGETDIMLWYEGLQSDKREKHAVSAEEEEY